MIQSPQMQVYDWTQVPREELNPLFARSASTQIP